MYLGVDIGSSSSKAVIIDKNKKVIAAEVMNIGTGSRGPHEVVLRALEKSGLEKKDITKCVATGYGRQNFDLADKQITEISCHAKGVSYECSDARTVIDIGGQDAKIIRLNSDGKVQNFVMNEKCAAGTGRFLEVMSRVLDCDLNYLSNLAAEGKRGVAISSVCTVFAESEMISQLSTGKDPKDVALGAIYAIVQRVMGLANRVGIEPELVLTGGVALNKSVIEAFEDFTHLKIIRLENPQIMGALGAALYAFELN